MSDPRIRRALEAHLSGMVPALPTIWQNVEPPATLDRTAPHQEAYLFGSGTRPVGVRKTTHFHTGIFQVNLCYPLGNGAGAIEARAKLIQERFAADSTKLERDGVTVRIVAKPTIGDDIGGRPGMYVVPVTIRYESIF